MRILINDFGPIITADVTLAPLTIFIGPNNSGKSYLSMIIHAIYESMKQPEPSISITDSKVPIPAGTEQKSLLQEFEKLRSELLQNKVAILEQPLLLKILSKILSDIFEKSLKQELYQTFRCSLSDLIRDHKEGMKIGFNSGIINIDIEGNSDRLKIVKKEVKNLNISLEIGEIFAPNTFARVEGDDGKFNVVINSASDILSDKSGFDFLPPIQLMNLINIVLSRFVPIFPKEMCYYLPAARSGLLHDYKTFITGILFKENQDSSESPSNIIKKFFNNILNMSTKKERYNKIANDFEEELFEGHIESIKKKKSKVPELFFTSKEEMVIPIARTSSSISELTPTILFLKHVLKKGDLLIFEEPEAHFHPANIMILAKYIIRLIRSGLKVLMITHNDFLLETINLYIKSSKLTKKKRQERFGYKVNDYIKDSEISLYLFKKDLDGFRVSSLPIDPIEGISQECFSSISTELYNTYMKFQDELKSEGSSND
jgi:predicted ATPase